MRSVFAVFVMLHGLVHLWYFVLSRNMVAFKPEMGWTGRSWLLTEIVGESATRSLGAAAFLLATAGLLVSGIGLLVSAAWWRSLLVVAAGFSAVVILVFWDGGTDLLVQRGLIGLLIDVGILVLALGFRWPGAGL